MTNMINSDKEQRTFAIQRVKSTKKYNYLTCFNTPVVEASFAFQSYKIFFAHN